MSSSNGYNIDIYKVFEFRQEFELVKKIDYPDLLSNSFNPVSLESGFTKINFGDSANGKSSLIRASDLENLLSVQISFEIQHDQFVSKIENNLHQNILWKSSSLTEYELSKNIRNHFEAAEINCLAVGKDGFSVILGDDNGLLHLIENVYNFNQPGAIKVYSGHAAHVKNVTFVGEDNVLISTGGEDMSIFVWAVE